MHRHGISFHLNADDIKINLPVRCQKLEVKSMKSKYFLLKLNSNKTEILLIGPTAQDKTNSASFVPLLDHIKPVARTLGVRLTVMSSFEQHTTKLV